MEIAQVVGFGVIAAVIIIFIPQSRPDIAQLLSIAVGIIIVVYLLGYLKLIVDVITDLALEAEISTCFLKNPSEGYWSGLSRRIWCQICRDTGEEHCRQNRVCRKTYHFSNGCSYPCGCPGGNCKVYSIKGVWRRC